MGIKIRSIWGKIPVPIIFINKLPSSINELCLGFFIIMEKKYIKNEGKIQHQLVHIKQYWKTFFLLPIFYIHPQLRGIYEIDAYKKELTYYRKNKKKYNLIEKLVKNIIDKYSINEKYIRDSFN